MAYSGEITTYGPNAGQQGLDEAMGFNNPFNAAAFGSRPSAPAPAITAGANTGAAIGAQQSVYNQLPGYAGSLTNIGANIGSETAGELPDVVKRQLAQAAAERGIATGGAGSDNSNASYLQSVGLESLDLTGLGQSQFQSILPSLPGNAIAQNPLSYVTPGQNYEAGLQNSIFASAPDPASAARASLGAVAGGFNQGRGSMGAPGLAGFDSSANDWWNQPAGAGTAGGGTTGPGGGGTYIGGVYYGPGQGPGNQDLLGGILKSYAPTVYGDQAGATAGDEIEQSQPAQLALGGFDSGAAAGGDNAANYPNF
jgi:hypothetical protein